MNTRTLAAVSAGIVAIIATTATAMTTSAAQTPDHGAHGSGHDAGEHHAMGPDDEAKLHDELAQVRRVTARFHDLDAALEAGYELGWVNGDGAWIISNCVANVANPAAGAMGYHYFNAELMADLAVDPLEPEVLVYAPGPEGQLRLAAVEWVARGPNTKPSGVTEAPILFGMPMHILNPVVGFFLMHAWVWQPNPAGMFADWNPDVTCP